MAKKRIEDPARRFSDIIWYTKDGRAIPVKNMTASHLRNTYFYLTRRVQHLRESVEASWSYCPQGDMASYYWEKDRNSQEDQIYEIEWWLSIFRELLEIRKIEIENWMKNSLKYRKHY